MECGVLIASTWGKQAVYRIDQVFFWVDAINLIKSYTGLYTNFLQKKKKILTASSSRGGTGYSMCLFAHYSVDGLMNEWMDEWTREVEARKTHERGA